MRHLSNLEMRQSPTFTALTDKGSRRSLAFQTAVRQFGAIIASSDLVESIL